MVVAATTEGDRKDKSGREEEIAIWYGYIFSEKKFFRIFSIPQTQTNEKQTQTNAKQTQTNAKQNANKQKAQVYTHTENSYFSKFFFFLQESPN